MSLCINPHCSNPQNSDTQLFCQNCGCELLLDGRYRVTGQLGSGGFGKTYEACDRDSTPKVLKVLTKNHPKYVELFQREAQVLTRLQHHGVPAVEADAYFTLSPSDRVEPLHCLVMEKIEGLNLQQYIKQRGNPIDQKLALQWLTQLATILREVHNQNFFHRDIKPSNIMLRADGQLVLIDFGTAREITDTLIDKQAIGQVTGVVSAGYTPPEQLNGQAMPQSDFFALGRTFVYLLTTQDPNQFYNSLVDDLHWHDAAPNVSIQLAELLDRMMMRLPSQRPQRAEDILQQLAAIKNITTLPTLSSQPRPAIRPGKPQQPAQKTEYVPYSGSATETGPASFASPTQPIAQSQVESDFVSRCQQELAEFIGPIASVICKRILNQNPNLSRSELIEALAQKIPDRQQAQTFRQRLGG